MAKSLVKINIKDPFGVNKVLNLAQKKASLSLKEKAKKMSGCSSCNKKK